jgi:hypothetical protein
MLSKQEEQAERRATLENDRRLREQTGTYLSHTHDDIHQGRFAGVGPTTIVGTSPNPYPPLPSSSPWSGPDLVGDEPPLSFDNPALLEQPSSFTAQATGGAPSPGEAPSFSHGEPMPDGDAPSKMPVEVQRTGVGSPPSFRRRI